MQIEAANALARCGVPQLALPVLTKWLESSDLDAVLQAARTIELLGPQANSAIDAMRAARQRAEGGGDPEMFVRFTTDAFLRKMEN